MTAESVGDVKSAEEPVKYGRGQNPASLSNLKPWQPGQMGNPNGARGPLITPHMRKLSELYKTAEIKELYESGQLTNAEEIAALALIAAAEGLDRGVKSRDQVMNRLDGEPEKQGPAIAVQVNLTFGDGQEA